MQPTTVSPPAPAASSSSRCSRSDRLGHDPKNCPIFPFARVDHPDAHLGAAVPHMLGELNVQMGDHRHVFVNGARYYIGSASGEGCNCLINTLVASHLVRADLRREFPTGPDAVTANNFLDFRAHSRHSHTFPGAIDPNNIHFICADLVYQGQGDIVGTEGAVTNHLARVSTNHFVPLIRQWGGR